MRSNSEPLVDRRKPVDGHHDRIGRTSPGGGSTGVRFVMCRHVLGGRFRFACNSRDLLDLVDAAYGGLPAQILPAVSAEFRIELCLLPRTARPHAVEPPAPRIRSVGDTLHAITDDSNYAVIEPARRCARIVASEDMLQHPYHLRYEWIEFAVFILAARGIGLVPLHAACVGWHGRGLLLLGDSGSGKSTLALHCLLQGMDLLAEDAVFVRAADLLAAGVPNYLHVPAETLALVEDDAARRWIAGSPVIRRRSGVEKFEVDLRPRCAGTLRGPLELAGAVYVSAQTADDPGKWLTRLAAPAAARLLRTGQPYASGQPGWQCFQQRLVDVGIHQLRRGRHPRDAAAALRRWLD